MATATATGTATATATGGAGAGAGEGEGDGDDPGGDGDESGDEEEGWGGYGVAERLRPSDASRDATKDSAAHRFRRREDQGAWASSPRGLRRRLHRLGLAPDADPSSVDIFALARERKGPMDVLRERITGQGFTAEDVDRWRAHYRPRVVERSLSAQPPPRSPSAGDRPSTSDL